MKIWFPVIRGGSGTDVFTRRLAEALERQGVTAEVTWFPRHYQFAPFFLRYVRPPSGTQVIHTNSWNGFVFNRWRIPLLVTAHLNVLDPIYGSYKNPAQRFFHEVAIRRFESASFRRASAITVVSESTRQSLGETAKRQAIQVVYNWIDTATFTPGGRHHPSSTRPFQLLFVGNLSRRKGADLLAPIMKELGPGFKLHFTSGIRRHNVKGLADNMTPLGRISDEGHLIEIYRQCDALLFPSRLEGFSLVPLEAMACGKPVVAAHTSSLPEVVEDGVTGILCPRDDIAAFVSACRKLADNPKTLLAYGQSARRRAEELFSEKIILPQYIAIYERLIDKNRSAKTDATSKSKPPSR